MVGQNSSGRANCLGARFTTRRLRRIRRSSSTEDALQSAEPAARHISLSRGCSATAAATIWSALSQAARIGNATACLGVLTAIDSNRLQQHSTSGALNRRTRMGGARAAATPVPGERGGVGGGVPATEGGTEPCSAAGDCGLRRTWRAAPAMPSTSGAACMHAHWGDVDWEGETLVK